MDIGYEYQYTLINITLVTTIFIGVLSRILFIGSGSGSLMFNAKLNP